MRKRNTADEGTISFRRKGWNYFHLVFFMLVLSVCVWLCLHPRDPRDPPFVQTDVFSIAVTLFFGYVTWSSYRQMKSRSEFALRWNVDGVSMETDGVPDWSLRWNRIAGARAGEVRPNGRIWTFYLIDREASNAYLVPFEWSRNDGAPYSSFFKALAKHTSGTTVWPPPPAKPARTSFGRYLAIPVGLLLMGYGSVNIVAVSTAIREARIAGTAVELNTPLVVVQGLAVAIGMMMVLLPLTATIHSSITQSRFLAKKRINAGLYNAIRSLQLLAAASRLKLSSMKGNTELQGCIELGSKGERVMMHVFFPAVMLLALSLLVVPDTSGKVTLAVRLWCAGVSCALFAFFWWHAYRDYRRRSPFSLKWDPEAVWLEREGSREWFLGWKNFHGARFSKQQVRADGFTLVDRDGHADYPILMRWSRRPDGRHAAFFRALATHAPQDAEWPVRAPGAAPGVFDKFVAIPIGIGLTAYGATLFSLVRKLQDSQVSGNVVGVDTVRVMLLVLSLVGGIGLLGRAVSRYISFTRPPLALPPLENEKNGP